MRAPHLILFFCLVTALGSDRLYGQVRSNCPPKRFALTLFPDYVGSAPPVETHEVSAPFPKDAPARDYSKAEDAAKELLGLGGQSDKAEAETYDDLAAKPKKAVDLANGRRWKEAAEAGEEVLREPQGTYNDFTWSYVGNAAGWACVQLGDLARAAAAHAAAATKVADPAVRQYHQTAAQIFKSTTKSADQLKDPSVYDLEFRQALLDDVTTFKKSVVTIKTAPTLPARISALETAYVKLRYVSAVDPVIAKKLVESDFRAAADMLLAEAAPALLTKAKERVAQLAALDRRFLRQQEWPIWNSEVSGLWAAVAEVKRVCRMHDYLVRLGLADAKDANGPFREANALLFAPRKVTDKPEELLKVYHLIGHKFDVGAGTDVRKHVPYIETPIKPM